MQELQCADCSQLQEIGFVSDCQGHEAIVLSREKGKIEVIVGRSVRINNKSELACRDVDFGHVVFVPRVGHRYEQILVIIGQSPFAVIVVVDKHSRSEFNVVLLINGIEFIEARVFLEDEKGLVVAYSHELPRLHKVLHIGLPVHNRIEVRPICEVAPCC